ncbi:DNA-3-methyladenine glycosylase [Corynebacterium lipophiloflavum DSM 44291]|uniref:Putative 3-methyladenine DNA glycosylase n=1 Tax=Corynebacterium lipophiloflavum (strain ATCC 700352 / DSM 44291 / CCUG 37336 / JCM 10383 / DMMZ 1944) TaxID=525263 RepID=C0XQ30_CORLD|nr:DNA-3-methyladenine glycosylase [Corynebacterium lipophiloflavum DSM 44291]
MDHVVSGIDFSQSADLVAPQLLGCIIELNGVAIRLTEVEAYLGTEDPAAHTYRGKTTRNAAMFGPPGRLYVYFSYGIHFNGNIVCAPEGIGHGCLMRGGQVVSGHDIALQRRQRPDRKPIPDDNIARGPGNLGQALGLTLGHNGTPVTLRPREAEPEWVAGPRIGISKNADAPLRFYIPGDKTVSSPRGRRR